MRNYMTAWRAAIKPSDKTGIATFTCDDKEVKFKMNNFQQYLDLCTLIDSVAEKVEKRNQVAIFEYINSYKKGY